MNGNPTLVYVNYGLTQNPQAQHESNPKAARAWGYIGYDITAHDESNGCGLEAFSYSAGNSRLDSQVFITSHPLEEKKPDRAGKADLLKWARITADETATRIRETFPGCEVRVIYDKDSEYD
jgi:hypothetical protein